MKTLIESIEENVSHLESEYENSIEYKKEISNEIKTFNFALDLLYKNKKDIINDIVNSLDNLFSPEDEPAIREKLNNLFV